MLNILFSTLAQSTTLIPHLHTTCFFRFLARFQCELAKEHTPRQTILNRYSHFSDCTVLHLSKTHPNLIIGTQTVKILFNGRSKIFDTTVWGFLSSAAIYQFLLKMKMIPCKILFIWRICYRFQLLFILKIVHQMLALLRIAPIEARTFQ